MNYDYICMSKGNNIITMNYKQLLGKLKQKYQAREVSALVGAGFSKNIAKEYPSWQQLLYDMVVWLYNYEIEQSYINHLHIRRDRKAIIDKISFEKDIVKKIIDREGYLNIVSQYIKKKGYREAIEIYIEERIPSIRHDKRDLYFQKEHKSIPLNPEGIELFNIFLDGFWENIFTTNYDHLLEYISRLNNKQWKNIITNDYELTSGNNKSIIKIHGHLRTNEDCLFGFDNDFGIRYIISKEDYDVYPNKHEAFTQLMRISLLKGIFCLFGFSGDDPNFLAWIRWVRDIIVKNPNERIQNTDDFKIFLLSLDENAPTEDKLQFYKNHRIIIIPLKSKEVKEILKIPLDETNPVVLFKCFFNYLYSTENRKNILIEKESYSSLWTAVAKTEYSKTVKNGFDHHTSIDKSILNNLIEAKPYNRFVKSTFRQEDILLDLNVENSLTIDKAKLAILAFKDTLYLPEWHPNIDENISKFLDDSEEWNVRYLELKEREKSLMIKDPSKKQEVSFSYYENVLRAAFTLNFKELKSLLDKWNPNNEEAQKKAGFYSVFDNDKSIFVLNEYIEKEIDKKERNYAQQQLDYLTGQRISPDKSDNIIDYRDLILKGLSKNESIKPYGSTSSQDNSEQQFYKTSFKAMQFLIETGWQNSRNGLTFINAETFYVISRNLFKDYPYPILYYILQYDGYKDILKRIGQDFAYSNFMQEENVEILEMLFLAYLSSNTPNAYKRSILWIASELLISVSPSKWRKYFIQIWTENVLDIWENIRRKDSLDSFIKNGLPYLDFKNSKQVIIDCIENKNRKPDTSIKYLYYNYDSLKRNLSKLKKDAELKGVVDSFIDTISDGADFVIAGNIFNLLTKEQLKKVAQKIEIIDTQIKLKPFNLKSMSFFAKLDSRICKVYKKIILNSPYLWDNGLNSDESASPPDFIEINKISYNIKWDKSELLKIYNSLCNRYTKLKNSKFLNDRDDTFFSNMYVSLLEEMLFFLIKNKNLLETQKDYPQIMTEINQDYINKRGFVIIDDALISDSYGVIKNGTDLLIREIELWGWKNYSASFNLLINANQ
ncbi:hypothetical protein M2474_001841 [Dysgonomonas sp. PH5-37]|nr:hypothetical protein [Dysgonomonas sp. PH5-37]